VGWTVYKQTLIANGSGSERRYYATGSPAITKQVFDLHGLKSTTIVATIGASIKKQVFVFSGNNHATTFTGNTNTTLPVQTYTIDGTQKAVRTGNTSITLTMQTVSSSGTRDIHEGVFLINTPKQTFILSATTLGV
jgi:hypothetical protein